MKKIVVFGLLAVIGIYGTGRATLGEAGAMRFVLEMDALMNEGRADEVCAMFHDDLEVDIEDHTSGATENVAGGKQELCDRTRDAVESLKKLPHTMRVEFNDVTVKRDWLHPWTSEVSYTEGRVLIIRGANVTISTTSNDVITLVQTFSGVKLRKLKAEAFLNE
ncbi:MAG TPA: hypothetical protein VFO82_15885 [Steroidobacteraceae bacterium]|nr:hypothetical protein [Steroidobacteraceae bacterium]